MRGPAAFFACETGYTGFEPVISAVTGQRHKPLD